MKRLSIAGISGSAKTRLGDLRVRERDAVDIYRFARERRDLYGGLRRLPSAFARRDIADLPEMPAEAEIAVRLSVSDTVQTSTRRGGQ